MADSSCKAVVEIQPDCGGAWEDISGEGTVVTQTGGEIETGESHTFKGDAPHVTGGKTNSIKLRIRSHYNEGAAEAFQLLLAVYEGDCPRKICARYTPLGAIAPNLVFTTVSGIMSDFKYPTIDANSADVLMGEFEITCAGLDTSATV